MAAFALAAAGSATTMSDGVLSAGRAAAQQASDYIADRSPGARTRADMSKGKPRLDTGRMARALPRVREAANAVAAPTTSGSTALPEVYGAPVFAAPADAGPGIVAPAAVGGPIGVGGSPGSVLGPFLPLPGVGTGGGGGPIIFAPEEEEETVPGPETPIVDTPIVPVPVTPIPEPASWAMMLLGFGAMGAIIRRRARHARHLA